MKKLFLALILLSAMHAGAQSFTQKAAFPGIPNWFVAAFTLGDKVYKLCGNDSNTTGRVCQNDLWQFNTTTNAWTQKNNVPFLSRNTMSTIVINGTAYAGFGFDSSSVNNNDWWKYNEASDAWTQVASLPAAARYGAYTFSWNNKGYVLGGSSYNHTDGHALNDFWEYNPASNAWSQLAAFPGTARALGFSQVIGDTLYMGLGSDDSAQIYFHDNFKCYLPTKTWSTMPAVPGTANVPEVSGFVSFQAHAGHKVMLLDVDIDFTQPSDLNMAYIYNSLNGIWTLGFMGNVPGFRVGGLSAQIGDKAYVGLGTDYYSNTWPLDMWEVNMQSFTVGVEETNPDLKNVSVGAQDHMIHTSVPDGLLQKGATELVLYNMEGKMLQTYTLKATNTLDARQWPAAVYTYWIRNAGKNLMGGKLMLE